MKLLVETKPQPHQSKKYGSKFNKEGEPKISDKCPICKEKTESRDHYNYECKEIEKRHAIAKLQKRSLCWRSHRKNMFKQRS